ncbi:MAG TPA: helix-turn-helix transcriptional regulator [Candidatus Obscuribacterales bacterium]
MFGDFVREHRQKRRLTLRQFCAELEFDPSQWSKIERGVLAPPKNEHMLKRIAQLLGVRPGSQPYMEMMDLAALGGGRVPADLLSDAELAQCLPMVFRTVRNSKPTAKELHALAELIRENVRRHTMRRGSKT